ncbi:septal ring lytic transglycosylase RlpA family protein [Aerophototrophica crusticola]|uniref:Endolytic peptidoglycan transglycosylase RlpA n=1 Tax=Aerophototrophica crusticola TaxID=1709002 RepID=A0A858R668_9PROT|nr:septal ring lytic transglycosylase RlpA family protein [Rhodospirillaceae bacterium B3]
MVRAHLVRILVLAAVAAGLSACATKPPEKPAAQAPAGPKLPAGGIYKVGEPYQINGVWYYPQVDYNYDQTGIASWYGPGFHTKSTANGETYNENELTAAHQTLPMPSLVRVTNLENGRSIVVRINDRGPFVAGRILDMSRRGAQLLGFDQQGTAKVRVQVLAEESRAIAAAAQNGGNTQMAGSPDGGPVPKAAPRPKVEVEGVPAPATPPAPVRTVSAPTTVAGQTDSDGRFLPAPVVEQKPVAGPQRIWVQAGAFSVYDNANKLRARLNSISPATISSAMVSGTQFFRVRLGPLETVDRADQVLAQVLATGQNQARIIVD